ncbi:hypothetical protein BH24ACI4_BH24ACI4_03390 [soil metagenome]
MSVRGRTDRNFRRASVKPGRRRRLRASVSWTVVRRALTALLLAIGIQQAAVFVFSTPLLRVDRIAVHGNVKLSNGQIQALMDDIRGTNIFLADLAGAKHRLTAAPWIRDVGLRRVLPSTVEVFVSERRPVGLCRLGDQLYLIDETGTIIDQFGPQYAEFDLPIIDGLVPGPGGRKGTIDRRRVELAARVISAIGRNRDVAARLSQVDVTNLHDAVVLLENDQALLHLGTDQFLERVQSYLELSSALRERVAEIDYVDMRFDRLVYVRPAPATRRPQRREPARAIGARQF